MVAKLSLAVYWVPKYNAAESGGEYLKVAKPELRWEKRA
jgi:hypothetical protein